MHGVNLSDRHVCMGGTIYEVGGAANILFILNTVQFSKQTPLKKNNYFGYYNFQSKPLQVNEFFVISMYASMYSAPPLKIS